MANIKIIDLNFKNVQNVIASFLIESQEAILVESGPDSTFQNLLEGLEKQGLKQQDIKHLFLTHIHLDHAGAAWHFAQSGAKIYVHPKGVKHLIDPSRLLASAKEIYKDQMESLWGNIKAIDKNSIIELQDEVDVEICGLKMKPIFTPGHAKHHACFLIDNYLFSGDEGGIRILDGPIIPPMPPPDINLEQWLGSLDKLIKLCPNFICPTHFGKFDNAIHHLETLRSNIKKYKTSISPKSSYEEFVYFVDSFFNSNDHIREFYKNANPDPMNFDGFLRYLKQV